MIQEGRYPAGANFIIHHEPCDPPGREFMCTLALPKKLGVSPPARSLRSNVLSHRKNEQLYRTSSLFTLSPKGDFKFPQNISRFLALKVAHKMTAMFGWEVVHIHLNRMEGARQSKKF